MTSKRPVCENSTAATEDLTFKITKPGEILIGIGKQDHDENDVISWHYFNIDSGQVIFGGSDKGEVPKVKESDHVVNVKVDFEK